MEALIVLWIACGIVGYMIDNGRGAILGLLLGILGIIVSLFLSAQDKRHKETMAALGVAKDAVLDKDKAPKVINVTGDQNDAVRSAMRAAGYRA